MYSSNRALDLVTSSLLRLAELGGQFFLQGYQPTCLTCLGSPGPSQLLGALQYLDQTIDILWILHSSNFAYPFPILNVPNLLLVEESIAHLESDVQLSEVLSSFCEFFDHQFLAAFFVRTLSLATVGHCVLVAGSAFLQFGGRLFPASATLAHTDRRQSGPMCDDFVFDLEALRNSDLFNLAAYLILLRLLIVCLLADLLEVFAYFTVCMIPEFHPLFQMFSDLVDVFGIFLRFQFCFFGHLLLICDQLNYLFALLLHHVCVFRIVCWVLDQSLNDHFHPLLLNLQ